MILGLGVVGLIGSWVMLIPYGLVFGLFYFCIIPAEEQFLLRTFGAQYQSYCDNVPRFFPRIRPWSQAARASFDWKSALGEWRVVLAVVGILLFFALSSLVSTSLDRSNLKKVTLDKGGEANIQAAH